MIRRPQGVGTAALAAFCVLGAAGPSPVASAAKGSPWTVVAIDAPALAWAPVESGAHAGCTVVLLGERTGRERSLLLACMDEGVPAVRALGAAPPGSSSVGADGRADGLRLLLGVPGGVDAIGVDAAGRAAAPLALLRDPDVHPYELDDRPDIDGDGRRDLVQAVHDGVASWRAEESGGFVPLGRAPVAPVGVIVGGEVTLQGRGGLVPSGVAGARADAAERWIGPRHDVRRRIGMTRIPLRGEDAFEPCTAWIRTEHPSAAWRLVVLPGPSPRVAALVARSDRASLLGEYDLLVAPLDCDATRRGLPPQAVVETKIPLGGLARMLVRDVDRDGTDDIVVVGVTGRLKPRAAVFAWRGLEGGRHERRPLEWDRRIRPAEEFILDWSHDVDRDGGEDLIVSTKEGLIVVPSTNEGEGGVGLAKRRAIVVPWPAGHRVRALIGPVGTGLLLAGGSVAPEDAEASPDGDGHALYVLRVGEATDGG